MFESGSGEPVDSSAPNDKDSSVCPYCDKEYASSSGVGYHVRNVHPEKMDQCPECGQLVRGEIGLQVHMSNAHRDELPSIECEYCGKVKHDKPSVIDRIEHCSYECAMKSLEEDHPLRHENYFECIICGEEFRRCNNRAEQAKCCSTECGLKYMKELRVGENHHSWNGGGNPYYGENWSQVRKKCLERDGETCQDCGATEDLHVHHIRPLRAFDEPEEANNLLNLVTLCRTCHLSKWEGIPLRPDTR